MIKTQDVVDGKSKTTIKSIVIAASGGGKTYFGATFPKSYFLITEPNGEDTWLTQPHLRKNVVGFDRFIPSSAKDTKDVFVRLDKACDEARELALKGEIETVVLDNMTYLAENRWAYINEYEAEFGRSGELNTMAMYGKLGRWLYNFTLMKLTALPCNLVITIHEKLESDEAMDKKPDKSNPIVPSILGGFRNDICGMVSLVLFLSKKPLGKGMYEYYARTNLGSGKNAKSRYANLPEVITNISYDTINKAIQDSYKVQDNSKVVSK